MNEETLFAWGWAIYLDPDGPRHSELCEGWTHDPRDGHFVCGCGAMAHELGPVAAEEVAA